MIERIKRMLGLADARDIPTDKARTPELTDDLRRRAKEGMRALSPAEAGQVLKLGDAALARLGEKKVRAE